MWQVVLHIWFLDVVLYELLLIIDALILEVGFEAFPKSGQKVYAIATDGLPVYHGAHRKGFWTLGNPKTEHVNVMKLSGDMNNTRWNVSTVK